ncbi:sigma-70 family RNA polymerase sigma factor [Alicyclobacillus mali]|uniref:Sigma-70 family RNA polymerase sigma factor n=1 Tax=Alicyclobacillus mali (ex Roth et al. 2021) TaxID=1123961 RepID=A0ABS0F443_9BACL|nr:sigma-70 family RNA polymerase sigma factor [Alicyclobacillus mali (ex Roth et al. 2021)]MBF8378072.1 sigma-70 family RNA polymerase sigma factor [Alicyclobacillus mali (ex Roth et al. 2021)]
MDNTVSLDAYIPYIQRLARRLIRYRRSAMIDEQDLISSAITALWQRSQEREVNERYAKQVIKYAMLTVLRNSALLKMPKSTPMAQAIQAYQRASDLQSAEYVAVEDPMERWENEELVRQAALKISELRREDQILLSLIFVESLSFQEAADVLNQTKAQVYHRYQSLIRQLQTSLGLAQ